uniref:Arrestin_C domain-containing protein n=2 Tax=Caenorhabditis tropicalis TaxID=1561998 RepID=A0A1I7T7U8_9PELO
MLSMKIPAIVPSFECPIISVDYCISVKLDTDSLFGGTLKVEFPLIIGTIPIRQMTPLAGSAVPAVYPTVSPSAPPEPVVVGGAVGGPVCLCVKMEHCQLEYDKATVTDGIVSGKVIIQNKEPIKARFLKIRILGTANIHSEECENKMKLNEYLKHEPEHSSQSSNNYECLINTYIMLWESSVEEDNIPAGNHEFPFSFTLPANSPPTFFGQYGKIEYSTKVELDRPWKLNKKLKRPVLVWPKCDLNLFPNAASSVEKTAEQVIKTADKNVDLVLKEGLVTLRASIPKQGYVHGEIIQIKLNIQNESARPVLKVRAEIFQFGKYWLRHKGTTDVRFSKTCLAKTSEDIKIEPKTKGEAIISIEVPNCVPNFQSSLIHVFYNVLVGFEEPTFGGVLAAGFYLLIGTVPIREIQMAEKAVQTVYPTVSPSAPPEPPEPVEAFGGSVYPSSSASLYPVVAGGASSVYPSAQIVSPGGGAPQGIVPSDPPPSYEESMYAGNAEDSKTFAPHYPVYNNLPQDNPAQATLLPTENKF